MARPRSFDEDQVLTGAMEAFRECGFDGVSLPQLIERLGICRQSLYTTFGDKRGLFLRALERYGQREVDAKLALLAGPGSPLENVRTVLRGWADMASRCPSDGCLTATAIVEIRDDPEALAIVEAHVNRLEAAFRDALERAREVGEIRGDVCPAQLASALTCTAYGIGVLVRLPTSGRRIGDTVSVLLRLVDGAATDS